MQATDLHPDVWNAITEHIERRRSPREITFGDVTRRDVPKKLIWLHEFGDTAIPLVCFDFSFYYYDTVPTTLGGDGITLNSKVDKKIDATDTNPAFRTHLLVPRVGQRVVILDMWGNGRFPICIGVVQSDKSYWQGETS